MKKFILFLFVVLLCSSCVCTLSQIPPQYIHVGSDCQALLPDYKLKVTAKDNCGIKVFEQTPAPGYLLTATNQVVNVTMRAVDVFNNVSEITFSVALLDTVAPTFTIDSTLSAYQFEQLNNLYDIADRAIARSMDELDRNIKDTTIFSPTLYPGLDTVYEDSTYYKRMMVTWTAPGHAVTGNGYRYVTFAPLYADSIMWIRRKEY